MHSSGICCLEICKNDSVVAFLFLTLLQLVLQMKLKFKIQISLRCPPHGGWMDREEE